MRTKSLDQSYVALLDSCMEFHNAVFADAEDPAEEPGYDTYLDMCTNAAVVICDKYEYNLNEINKIIDEHSKYPDDAKWIVNDWIETITDQKDEDSEFMEHYQQYMLANPNK